MDVLPTIPNTSPPPGWARLELEPIDVPLEPDDSILLSTIQSVIPGAHGLYYKDGNHKQALKYDGLTGRISKGLPGWNTKPIYVVLAHGCHHYNGSGIGQYNIATERFEKTVNLVHRMLTGFDQSAPRGYSYGQAGHSKTIDRKHDGERSKREDQRVKESDQEARADNDKSSDGSIDSGKSPKTSFDNGKLQNSKENELSSTYLPMLDGLQKKETVNEKEIQKLGQVKNEIENQLVEERRRNADLEKLSKDLEWSLGEHKQWLNDAEAKIKNLERMLDEERNNVQSLADLNAELNTKTDQTPPDQEHNKLQQLKEELNIKQQQIDNLIKKANDVEWNLGEHKEWLQNANNKANHYESLCQEKDRIIEDLKNQLRVIESHFTETSLIEEMIENNRKEIERKDGEIAQLEKLKNDAEWSLGEHRQWLQDAYNRINIMENEKTEGWRQVQELNEKLSRLENAPTWDEYNQMKTTIEELQNKVNEKNRECEELNKQKNDAQWDLREHKCWLENANKRIKLLEDEDNEKCRLLTSMNNELSELKKIRLDAFQQLHDKIDHLGTHYGDKERFIKPEPNITSTEQEMLLRDVEELQKQLDVEDKLLKNSNATKDDAKWNLDNYKRLLEEANNRIKALEEARIRKDAEQENAMQKLNDQINELQQRNNELRDEVQAKQDAYEMLRSEGDERRSLSALPEDDQMMKETQRLQVRVDKYINLFNQANDEKEVVQRENDELKRALNDLREKFADMEAQLEIANKSKSDVEWLLDEHKQQLQDLTSRINELENVAQKHSDEKDEAINKLNEMLTKQSEFDKDELDKQLLEKEQCIISLKKDSNDKENDINSLKSRMEELLRELDNVRQNVADAEWKLGEHRQWLQDANDRNRNLEATLDDKNRFIDELKKQVEEQRKEMENIKKTAVPGERNVIIDKEELEALRMKLQDAECKVAEAVNEDTVNKDKINELNGIIDCLRSELSGKNDYIGNLEKQRNDAEWHLGEHRQWLLESNNRANWLDGVCLEKDRIISDLETRLREAAQPDDLSLQETINTLKMDLEEKNNFIASLEKAKNDAEWNLDEHRQWLQDATNRNKDLEGILKDTSEQLYRSNQECEHFKAVISQIEEKSAQTIDGKMSERIPDMDDQISKLEEVINELKNVINENSQRIDDLNKAKNDAEWFLGENRQWLADANKRIEELEQMIAQKDITIDALRKENDTLMGFSVTPFLEADLNGPVDDMNESVVQLREKVQSLQKKILETVKSHPETPNTDDNRALTQLVSDIYKENVCKSATIDDLLAHKMQADVHLVELQQKFEDAKNRIGDLEVILVEKDEDMGKLRRELEEYIVKTPEKDANCQELMNRVKSLEAKLEEMEHNLNEAPKPAQIKNLTDTIEKLRKEINIKNDVIGELQKGKNDAEWNLGEHRQWLHDANNKTIFLVNSVQEKDKAINDLRHENEALRRAEEVLKATTKKEIDRLTGSLQKAEERLAEQDNTRSLNAIIDELNKKMEKKNDELRDLRKQKEEVEWELGERKQWLIEAHTKVDGLEQLLREKDAIINQQYCEIDNLKNKLEVLEANEKERHQLLNDIVELKKQLDEKEQILQQSPYPDDMMNMEMLRDELTEKRDYITHLEKQLNDTEWSLGEHKQWLHNANNKINDLEKNLSEKDSILDELNQRIDKMGKDLKEDDDKKVFHQEQIQQLSDEIAPWQEPVGEKDVFIDELQQNVQFEALPHVVTSINVTTNTDKEISDNISDEYSNACKVIDELRGEMNAKNDYINELTKQRNDAQWYLGEHKQWLSDTTNWARSLVNELEGKDKIIENLRALLESTEKASKEVIDDLQRQLASFAHIAPETDKSELNETIENLQHELNVTRNCISKLEKAKNDAEWNLGEHRQWLHDAKNQVQILEEKLKENSDEVGYLKKEIEKLNSDIRALSETIESNQKQMDEKNDYITQIEKSKNDLEWSIEEHKQWLHDANKRNADLENILSDKNRIIDELNDKISRLGNEVDDIRKQMASQGSELTDKNRQIDELHRNIENLQKENDDLKNHTIPTDLYEELERKLHELEQLKVELPDKEELFNLRTEHQNLRQELDVKNDYIENLEKEKKSLEESFNENRQLLEENKTWANSLENELKNKNDIVSNMEQKIHDKDMNIDELKIEIDGLKEKVQQLEHDLDNGIKTDDFEALKKEIKDLHKELSVKNDHLLDLERKLTNVERDLDKSHQELCAAKDGVNSYESLVTEKNDLIDDLSKQIWEKDGQVDKLGKEIEILKAKLELIEPHLAHEQCQEGADPYQSDIVDEVHENLNQFEQMPVKSIDDNSSYEKVSNLQAQLAEKEAQLENLEKQKNDTEWSLGEHRQWLQDANNRAECLENALKEKNQLLDDLRRNIDEINRIGQDTKAEYENVVDKLQRKVEELEQEQKKKSAESDVKVRDLTNDLVEKTNAAKENEQLIIKLQEAEQHPHSDEEINALKIALENLHQELNNKNDYVHNLEQQRNDAEWKLGEHRQWLQDTNNWANSLKNACEEKDRLISELERELQNAKQHANILNCLEAENDDLKKQMNEKNTCIDNLIKERDDKEESLGEHRKWLEDANGRIGNLEDTLKGRDTELNACKKEIEKLLADIKALFETIESLQRQLNEKDDHIRNVEKQRNDTEWSLGEHRQWLQDANNRLDGLEDVLKQKTDEIDWMKQENDRLKEVQTAQPSEDALKSLEMLIDELKQTIEEKNARIENLEKLKNDTEWSLGEHRQWLTDAKNRMNELSRKLTDQEKVMELLSNQQQENVEDKCIKTDEQLPESVLEETDKNKLFEKIFELEEKLNDAEKAMKEMHVISLLKEEYEVKYAELRKELDRKNVDLERNFKERCEAEWLVGEERKRIKDANERIADLLNDLSNRKKDQDVLSHQNEELRNKLEDIERKLVDATQSSAGSVSSIGEARIAQLEDELARTKEKYHNLLEKMTSETFELREKNTELEATVKKMEVVIRNLMKEAKTSMLILQQTIGLEDLKEQFEKLRENYIQLCSLLANTEEQLNKLRMEASKFEEMNMLRKVNENLNDELRQRIAASEKLSKQKNDAEWELGEHREWLQNANNRISNLENELSNSRISYEKDLMNLRAQNDALSQKNVQLKEQVKKLEEENAAIYQSVDEKQEELNERAICPKCGEDFQFNYSKSIHDELSAVSSSLQDLRKDLNYQRIIDTLMGQRDTVAQSLDKQKQSLIDAYNRIVDLEQKISEGFTAEQLEVIEKKTDVSKIIQEAEKIPPCEISQLNDFADLLNQLDEFRHQLDDKCTQIKNLEELQTELEKNLEEAKSRIEGMAKRLDEGQCTITAIIDEKNAIIAERDVLKQQLDDLEKQLKAFSSYDDVMGNISNERDNARELEVKLHEKDGQLQQITSEIIEKEQDITNLHNVIQNLRAETNEKNRIIDDLNRIVSEKEWSLGEHRQWLSDATNKINYLETELDNVQKEANSNKEDLERLKNATDEKKILELQNKIAQLESEALNAPSGKETANEQEMATLQEKLANMEQYVVFLKNEIEWLKQENVQTPTERRENPLPGSPNTLNRFDTSLLDYNDLSSELITLNRKKYKLEEKVKQLEAELQGAHNKLLWLEDEQRKKGEEIWLAMERVANQGRELENLHGHCSWLQGENARLQNQIDEDRRRAAETNGIDWPKFDELKSQMKQMEDTLRDEKSKVEWRLGEVTQYWNDAKWKIGELEASMAHKQWLLDQANQKICELDRMYRFRDTTMDTLNGAFLIRKQPGDGRYKWRLAMWNENSPDDLKDYRRIWFEITAATAKIVLLCASFVNWECFLQCQKFDNEAGKFGVWVDIPPGRYEFVFVVDGNWMTSDNYPTCYNEHGTQNNWKNID